MNRYRFKTREEFELIGRWIDEDECPQDWTEEMNEYLGQEIVNSDCIALCESNDEFHMDGWSFSNHDYVIIDKSSSKETSLVGRWVKLLRKIASDQPIGSYDLIIEDDAKRSCINLEKYRMCARERLTDGDLELMPEGWNPDSKPVEYYSRFNIGDWIIWDGSYKGEPIQLASIEDGGHKDTDGNWRDTKSPYYRLVLPHDLFDKNANVFPTNWCLKITDDNEYILNAWRKRQPDFYELVKTFKCWLISDRNDGTYTNWSDDVPDGYTEITFEQFKKNVLCSSLFLDSKDVINKAWEDGLKGILYNPVINPILEEDLIAFSKKNEKPLIENVQSIDVNLRTKKKNNKLIF